MEPVLNPSLGFAERRSAFFAADGDEDATPTTHTLHLALRSGFEVSRVPGPELVLGVAIGEIIWKKVFEQSR